METLCGLCSHGGGRDNGAHGLLGHELAMQLLVVGQLPGPGPVTARLCALVHLPYGALATAAIGELGPTNNRRSIIIIFL